MKGDSSMEYYTIENIIKRVLIQSKKVFVLFEKEDGYGERVIFTGKTKEDCLKVLDMTEEQFQNQLDSAIKWNSRELGVFEEPSFHCYYSIEEYSLSKLFNEMVEGFNNKISFYSNLLKEERAKKAETEKEIKIEIVNEIIENLKKVIK